MWATLYRPLSEEYPTFQAAKLTDIFKIISYNYAKRFCSVGEFTMEIPINEPAVPYITADTVLITDDGDDLYVTDTEETAAAFTIKGYDLKYLLTMRLTLFPSEEQDKGTYGYYVVKGSSEYCIKEIVKYNITQSENLNRQIYGFTVAANQDRGIVDDRYMTRLETLDTVAGTLCSNAGIGWDVTADVVYSKYIFDVIIPTDRSDNQHDVSKVIFAEQFLNVTGVTRQLGVSALKNAVYAVNGSGGPYVQLVNRDGEEMSGIFRKETTVNVNCDYDEIQDYALKEAEDKIQVDVLEMEVRAAETYKSEWFIGDIVTFKYGNLQLDSSVTQVEVSRTADKYEVKLTAGENVPTTIGALSNAINKCNNNKTIFSESSILSEIEKVKGGDIGPASGSQLNPLSSITQLDHPGFYSIETIDLSFINNGVTDSSLRFTDNKGDYRGLLLAHRSHCSTEGCRFGVFVLTTVRDEKHYLYTGRIWEYKFISWRIIGPSDSSSAAAISSNPADQLVQVEALRTEISTLQSQITELKSEIENLKSKIR